MYHTLSYDGKRYALYTMGFQARARLAQLEMYELFASSAGTTVAQDDPVRRDGGLNLGGIIGVAASVRSLEQGVLDGQSVGGVVDSVVPLRDGIVSLVADLDNFVSVGADEFEVNVGAVKILEADDVSARFNVPVTLDLQGESFIVEAAGQEDPLTVNENSAIFAVEVRVEHYQDSAAGQIELAEARDNGTATVGFKAPASLSTNCIWTLPSADGTAGQFLSTNGSKVLSFATMPIYSPPVDELTGNGYTLVASDKGRYKRAMWNLTYSFNINSGTFSTGDEVEVEMGGTGAVNIMAGSGVTLLCPSTYLTNITEQYSRVRIKCVASNTYVLDGGLEIN
jgi:hypothetical protein